MFTLENCGWNVVRKNLLENLYGTGSCEWCILGEESISQEVYKTWFGGPAFLKYIVQYLY